MSPVGKRVVAVVVAAGALGGAAAASAVLGRSAAESGLERARKVARSAQQTAHDALLKIELDKVVARVTTAVQIPQLRREVGLGDAPTIQKDLKTEDWWKEMREEFPVYALMVGDQRIRFTEGMAKEDLADQLLVEKAASAGRAAGEVVMGQGWPYLAAAAPVAPLSGGSSGVLVLARPIADEVLKTLADRAAGAVLLTNGRKTFSGGPDKQQRLLRENVVGKQAEGGYTAGDGSWAAASEQIAPGLLMWTYADTAAAVAEAGTAASGGRTGIWAGAGVLALVALVLGFRKGAGAPETAALSRRLAETEAELARMTTPSGGRTLDGPPVTGSGATVAADPAPGGRSAPRTATPIGTARTQAIQTSSGMAGPAAGGAATFGRYQLVDRLGEGGMAEVYTAVTHGAEGFRRTFVIKRLRAELARDPEVVAQFIDEANLGSTLVHSNIIPVFDFGKVGDEYFLAQEYILGRDFGRVVRRAVEKHGRPLAVGPTLFVAHETLRALEYAHGRLGEGGKPLGIVHRDVSPNNILVSARGEVKLFDFGIVKAEGRVTKTQHGIVKGNVSFMSPEQARGLGVDARADLFSLALCVFYALSGDVLYRGSTTYELLVKAATGPGPEEMQRILALPEPAPRILGMALQVDAAARYQSAAEFAGAIAPFVTGAGAEVARLMQSLFSDDFRDEETRFATTSPGLAAQQGAARTGTASFGSREAKKT